MPTKPQTRSNHTRFDPPFHFVLAPASLALTIWTIARVVRDPGSPTFIDALLALLVFATVFLTRVYSLRAQDRIIRLEERLRLTRLLPESMRSRIYELRTSQLIALRFASDAEIPALVDRSLNEKLTSQQIKNAIQSWRGDYERI